MFGKFLSFDESRSGSYVSQTELNNVVTAYKQLMQKLGALKHLVILFESDVKEVDITLIGYLVLFKMQEITLEIHLHLRRSPSFEMRKRLRYYLAFAVKCFEHTSNKDTTVFDVTYDFDPQVDEKYNPIRALPKARLLKTISPIFPIGFNRNDFDSLFVNTFTAEQITEEQITEEQITEEQITEEQITQTDSKQLAGQAFNLAIGCTGMHKRYWLAKAGEDTENIQVKSMTKIDSRRYFDAIVPIFNELNGSPRIFHLITYFLLQNTDITKSLRKGKNQSEKEYQKKIEERILLAHNLWSFAKGLIYSLTELAKNIKQHASTRQGVLMCRFYNEDHIKSQQQIPGMDYKLLPFLSTLSDEQKKDMTAYVDINVIDLGEKGVIQTMTDHTKTMIDDPRYAAVKTDLQEDYEVLNNKQIRFQDLLESKTTVLNQQKKRSIAHLGLLSLAQLVRKNNGQIIASTHSSNANPPEREISNGNMQSITQPEIGTNYNILYPLSKSHIYQSHHGKVAPGIRDKKLSPNDIRSYDKLLDYTTAHAKQNLVRITPSTLLASDRKSEMGLLAEIEKHINDSGCDKVLFTLDFCKVMDNGNLTGSMLLRLLAQLFESFPQSHFLVYNVAHKLFLELLSVNQAFCKHYTDDTTDNNFWSERNAVVVFSYVQDNSKRFYVTDVLWGSTKHEFIQLNYLVDRTHYNSTLRYLEEEPQDKEQTKQKKQKLRNESMGTIGDLDATMGNHPAFINRHVLLPFDSVLQFNGKTLFEYNASFLLQQEIMGSEGDAGTAQSRQDKHAKSLLNQLKNVPGFKISQTHFKLGSKIHVTDFYYAKRFFQNSFFASRFAFILAHKILKQLKSKQLNKQIAEQGLTLIGYGVYAELLTTFTKRFLGELLEKNNVVCQLLNHNLIADEVQLDLVKVKEPLYNNCIIIVPIASTFSTGIKIEEKLAKIHPNLIVQEFYNILWPAHQDEKLPEDKITELEQQLGFKDKDIENSVVRVQQLQILVEAQAVEATTQLKP